MGRWGVVLVGGVLGVVAALALEYVLGPAPGTTFDAGYQSRLDYALAEGRRAAAEREQELTRQYRGIQLRGKDKP